ncbi:S41 family peptidase [uncultured Polaribacter sp.]|uniref:S41 family peptidase n=1 Tax=uncultured Polaribacter sp. TaxID=174711 RepID=UPI002614326E|nr:S41 family peptidase [uncultured Polaribacter sp.]
MKQLILFFTLFSISIYGQNNPQWMRHSSISPDGSQIAFTYKGDLYKVNSAGGNAQQLTYHSAHDYKAVWNKDGSKIAFASNRYGNFDIFVMSSNGGQATRLTFHSNDEHPYSFSANDNEVVFGALRQDAASHRQFPHSSQSELYSVPISSGKVTQLLTIPAEYVQYSKDGKKMIYHDKKGGENEWRKHHTSSITRDIWTYDTKSGAHKMITSHHAEDRQPIFSKDEKSIYYLSERSGTFNIHKLSLENPNQDEQLTNFKLHPIRFLSVGNGVVSFGYDGELYTMREGEKAKKIYVNIITQDKENTDKFISVNGGINEISVSPNGKEIAFIARGEVFVTSVDKSFTKRLTNTPERERFVSWGPKGESVIYSSERNGKWSVFKTKKTRMQEPFFYAATLIKEEVLIDNTLDNYLAEYSPDGKKIAFIEGRRTLKIRDVKTNKEVTLLTPKDLFHMRDGDKYFTWSPDSKWLLVDWSKTLSNSEVLLMAADGSKRINLNESGYYDASPKWVNDGKQMIWFSNKNGLKSYATSGRSQNDVYSMFFTQDAWDEFNLSDEDYKLKEAIKEVEKKKKEKEEKNKKDDKKKGKNKKEEKKEENPLTFDWDNMKDRTKRLTIHSSRLGDAVLSKKGDKLYYLASFEGKSNLWSTNLRTRETKMLMKLNVGFGSLQWDKEMKNLYLLSSGKITKLDPETKKQKGVQIKGEIKLDEYAEREAMFSHVWIRTNAIFYHPDFHGVDWGKMKNEYQKYLPHISNTYEFSEMLSEMLGELNVSHAGAGYRGSNVSNADTTASLGIFMNYNYTDDGILIEEIIKDGPLDKAKFKVTAGMIIKKIDGVSIEKNEDVAKYFNRKVGKFMLLDILDPKTKKTQTITIKPISLGDENRLLYDRWVKINEKEVEKLSNGQLGYVHIPGMGDGPYRSIYQDMMGKYSEKKGVIVDTRFNGGGDLVADLAMFFTGVPFITYATEAKVVGGEPTSRWVKPTLSIFNESMYSDGHCYASGYTDLKIGKTVGMPVPGTCSFAGWESLPNGSYWGVVPISAKNKAGEWMENNQTEPLIQVKNMPGQIDNGIDQQLLRSIRELMKDVE